jgi:16S rRNA (cytosine967-C5)-methyltransferase
MQLASYVLIAKDLLSQYVYPEPLHLFLKKAFRQNKKYGSRDRKIISDLLYAHFRSTGLEMESMENALQLQSDAAQLYQLYDNNLSINQDLFQELMVKIESLMKVKYPIELSLDLSVEEWRAKCLTAPFTFIRILRNKKNILDQLAQASIAAAPISDDGFALPQKVKLNELKIADSDFSIQDANSQLVSNKIELEAGNKVWDVCAASGGKSIALMSRKIPFELFVSDIRPQILENLKHRFKVHGFKANKIFKQDATQKLQESISVDTLLIDAPCSGSGTWARTPEHLANFTTIQLDEIVNTQEQILQNTWKHLLKGGHAYYITCSVFAAENELQVNNFLAANKDAQLIHQQLYKGHELNADFMYMAIIKKV